MRGVLLEPFYVISSLWGSHVCPINLSNMRATVPEAWVPPPQAAAAVTAFIDVNVIPMDTERVLPKQTVVVEKDRIVALGPSGKVPVPAGAVRVDGRGKYLMPGLGDMHSGPYHNFMPPAGEEQAFAERLFIRYTARGFTTIRFLDGTDSSSVPQLRRIAADFPIPHIHPAFRGIPRLPLTNSDSGAAKIAAIKADGYSQIAGSTNLTAVDSLTLVALRQGKLPLVTHWHTISFPQALKLGIGGGSVEHMYMFWDSLLGRPYNSNDQIKLAKEAVDLPMAKVPALVAAMKRAGLWMTPTLKCMEEVHPYVKGNGFARIVKAMHDGGVKLLLGGDDWGLRGPSAHQELVALVRAGLTPYEALRMGTWNVAEYFGVLDSVGTVKVGKRADLVLLDGNPLQDVRHTWVPAGVMLAGRWFDRAALDQRQLASPRLWFEELLVYQIPDDWRMMGLKAQPKLAKQGLVKGADDPAFRSLQQWNELKQRGEQLYARADSMAGASHEAYGRLLPLVTADLGAIRAFMTSKEQAAFDMEIPMWLREQARRGYTVTIPGVGS